jgi:Lon protease-like protein
VTERIALFPLGHVLMPGAALPLHIFEPRYQAMITDLVASTPPAFGVLSIHRGIETSEDVAFAAVGTMAEIVNRRPYPDGTSDLLTVGSRRFRVRELLRSGRPYLRADVEWLAETVGGVTPGLLAATRALFERYAEVIRALAGETLDVTTIDADPVPASYQLAGLIQLTREDRQGLLAAPTAAHRLHAELVLMRREITLLQQTRTAPIDPRALWINPAAN